MKPTLTLLAVVAMLAPASIHAQTVAWGTSVNANLDGMSTLRTSTGASSNLTWAIGYFKDVTPGVPYVPTASNYSTWNLNWISVDTTTAFPAPDLNISGIKPDVGGAAAGRLGYMWAYSDINAMGTPGAEAFLATESDWTFPSSPNTATWDIADNTLSAADNNMTVIWGRVDRLADAAGGVLTGGGIITNMLADSNSPNFDTVTFEVQSATWAAPVPEPSSLLAGGLALLGLFGRRKRSV
jgi:hypothetical protein